MPETWWRRVPAQILLPALKLRAPAPSTLHGHGRASPPAERRLLAVIGFLAAPAQLMLLLLAVGNHRYRFSQMMTEV